VINRKAPIIFLGLALLVGLACNPLSNVLGGEAGTAANLWSDVPPYPGMEKVDLELPLFIRVAVEAASKAIMSSAGDASGNLEFITFTTTDSPQDVMAFYTVDRMEGEGWVMKEDQPGCTTGGLEGQDTGGGMCIFGKEGEPQSSVLFVVIAPESDKSVSDLFYVRIDANADAMATAAAQ
jgi:hypothetical protein